MARLILIASCCLLLVSGAYAGVSVQLSVGDNYPQNGEPNVHLTLSVPEDDSQPEETYGVLMYYKGPWRLKRSGDRWSPQRIAGGKAFMLPPNTSWGFLDVTLPCAVCTGEYPGPEQPIQPTPYTREIDLSVPFQNYACADGEVTAEVWRSVPPENPMLPGYLTCVSRKTAKVKPTHEHAIIKVVPPPTQWVTEPKFEACSFALKVIKMGSSGVKVVGAKQLEQIFCRKIAKKIIKHVEDNAEGWLLDAVVAYVTCTTDFIWETRTWHHEYALICCHGEEPDWERRWDEEWHSYWAPHSMDFHAQLQADRLRIVLHIGAREWEIFKEFGYTSETTTNLQAFLGENWGYCIMPQVFPEIPTHTLPSVWWTSDEKNYQFIGPWSDLHEGPCGENPPHYPVYTGDPNSWLSFPPPELIR